MRQMFYMFLVYTSLWVISSRAEERLWVNARINGKPVRLIFDTGATHAVLFTKAAERLGLKYTKPKSVQASSPFNVVGGKSEPCELSSFGNTNTIQFAVYDLPGYLRTEADGVLGWGKFRKNIFWIDASQDELSTLSRVPESAQEWKRFRLKTDTDIVTFEIPGNRRTNTLVLDTGLQGGLSLAPEKWQEWKSGNSEKPFTLDSSFMPAAGISITEEAWAERIAVGQLCFTGVPVTIANSKQLTSPELEAVIGLTAMKQLQIVVDGEQEVVYINIKRQSPRSYQHNRLGAVFVPNNPRTDEDLVAHVAPKSPAQKAGIQNGDVLLRVGDVDMTKWRTNPSISVNASWKQPKGTKYQLALRRGQHTNEVSVTLEDILGP